MPARAAYVHHAVHDSQLYLAFEGSASHRVSLATEHLTADFLALQPPHPAVVLDLAACGYIDSTFAGWMISLQKRIRELGGRVIISRCPEACQANLAMLGLTSLFEFAAVPPPNETERITCDQSESDAEAIEVMLHAHEDLASINSDNKRVFAPIAESLRKELRKRN